MYVRQVREYERFVTPIKIFEANIELYIQSQQFFDGTIMLLVSKVLNLKVLKTCTKDMILWRKMSHHQFGHMVNCMATLDSWWKLKERIPF